ncbi:MAG: hypothetical protein HY914_14465 [Desulfomonile tiedjei]|nr:hypothetical protein [Desulfomonile tiedjei]
MEREELRDNHTPAATAPEVPEHLQKLEKHAFAELATALDNLHDVTHDYDASDIALADAWSWFRRARRMHHMAAAAVDNWDQDPAALAWVRAQNALSGDQVEIDTGALVACLDEPESPCVQ